MGVSELHGQPVPKAAFCAVFTKGLEMSGRAEQGC